MEYTRINFVDGGTYGAADFNKMDKALHDIAVSGVDAKDYKKKQNENLGKALKKLRTNISKVSEDRTEVCFMGDSVFYAFDFINADGKAIAETCTPDNGTPLEGFSRRPVTIYDTFLSVMNRTYGDTVKIKKKIYTGDCILTAFHRWNPCLSDFLIINFGINDAVGSHIDESYHPEVPAGYKGNVELYIQACRKLFEREIDNGTAVVFMTPTKHTVHRDGLDTDDRVLIDVYEQAGITVAKEYGIPVIDGNELTRNFDNTMFIDGIHYTDKGFEAIGSRMASYFIGQSPGYPFVVESGCYQGIVPQLDSVNIVTPSVLTNTSYSPNFPISLGSDDLYTEIDRHLGGIQANITTSGKVTWSFYCPSDNMIAIPSVYTESEGVGCRMRIDFGAEQGSYNNFWNVVGTTIDRTQKAPGTIEIENTSFVAQGAGKCYGIHMINSASQPVAHIVGKGWHTIEVTPVFPPTTPVGLSIPEEDFGDGTLSVFGLNFLSFQDYKRMLV